MPDKREISFFFEFLLASTEHMEDNKANILSESIMGADPKRVPMKQCFNCIMEI
jgi:hypothetical protein